MMAFAQDIEVGPIRVDTGNDWQDLAFFIVIVIVLALFAWARSRWW